MTTRKRNPTPALPFCHVRLAAEKPPPASLPKVLKTWGDHLRRCRRDLGLLQREAAERIGCSVSSVNNWETNRTQPKVNQIPGIIDFLGYCPSEPGMTFGGWIRTARAAMGLSRQKMAARLGVDESTLRRWESGAAQPLRRLEARARAAISSTRTLVGLT